MMTSTRIAVAALALCGLMLAAGGALAQVGLGPGSAYTRGGNAKFDTQTSAPVPKALPGARGVGSRVAPSERSPADMKPTEALFDAVNRGDMSAARDAISRGAEIEGRNMLGLTPLELAIDLGRNELTFLLLSMRGATSPPAAAPLSRQAASIPPVRAPPPRAAPARPALVAAAPTPVRPRQLAGASGTPSLDAGFLGFGGALR